MKRLPSALLVAALSVLPVFGDSTTVVRGKRQYTGRSRAIGKAANSTRRPGTGTPLIQLGPNAAPGGPLQNGTTVLASGEPFGFSLPAVDSSTVFYESAFRIDVPEGAERLQVDLLIGNFEVIDVNLYMRFGSPLTNLEEAEFISDGLLGVEQFTVTAEDGLQAGSYFITIALLTIEAPVDGFLTATVSGDTYPGTVLTPGQPAGYSFVASADPTLFNGSFGYRVDVPARAIALAVSMDNILPSPDADVDLYVRQGTEPVLGAGEGGIDADFSSRGATGNESILIDETTTPPLQPGTSYFVAVEVRATNVDVDGAVLAAVVNAEPGPPPAISPGGTISSTLRPLVTSIAPRSIISVFGENFAPAGISAQNPQLDVNGNITTNLAGTCLEIDGQRAAMLALFPTQINAQVSDAVGLGDVSVVVIEGCGSALEQRSPADMVTVAEVSPAFFNFTNNEEAANPIAAVHGGGPDPVGSPDLGPQFTPAAPGDFISLFGTGFGPTDPALEGGEIPASALPDLAGQARLTLATTVMIGDIVVPAGDIFYIGTAPCCAGLYQLVVKVPDNAPDGNLPVILTVGGVATLEGPYITVQR